MTGAQEVADSPAPVSSTRANVVFVTVVLGMLMAALDQTIVSTALPTIVADLGGSSHLSWVVTSYLLAEAVATALAGKFGDLFGRKLVFQLSGLIFIVGSMIAGLANGMTLLVVARGIQGLGAGGLMVTAMALIADVIPLRDRGKYQGALGAVFGVTTVIGPTLGGLFTDHASWRWCFYVNVPLAIVMIVVAARAIPSLRGAVRPVIDYAGIAFVAIGVSCLVLGLEWGGQEYPWGSATIIGLFIGAAVSLGAFVFIEFRAKEPMLPMHLFRSNAFTVCSVLSFIVGFAMMGALTYLPAYMQYVNGLSATASGFRTLPMVVGLFITSIISGQVVGQTGKYKYFPIAGTAVTALGLYLMSTMDRHTGFWTQSLYMFVLGLGLGLAMQVLTIVVQNTVPYTDLGTATSGVTFFRTVGSTVGTSVFGTLYSNRLNPDLRTALANDPGVPPAAAGNPQLLHKLPHAQAVPIIDAYADTIAHMFRWAVPIALLGFVVAWFLKQVPLRDTARADAGDVGAGFSMPDSADRVVRLEHAVASLMRKVREEDISAPGLLARAGSPLHREQAWALGQVRMLNGTRGEATLDTIARAHHVPPEVLRPVYDQAVADGYVEFNGDRMDLTDSGHAELDRIKQAVQRWLSDRLDDWDCHDPDDRALLDQALANIAAKLLDESQRDGVMPTRAT